MKLEFSVQIFETYSNIKFRENPPSGSRDVPCEQTDIHDEAYSHFLQFSEIVYKGGKLYKRDARRNFRKVHRQGRV